ncbi:MAG: response regulator [archaeon]|nr:response regulator [Nanoarchaeota archaeon]
MAKILLIDDTDNLRSLAKRMLSHFEFIEAPNAIDGLELLTKHDFEIGLILLDYKMPKMNGYQFCQRVHESEEFNGASKIPIVGIGSFPEDQREYLKACHPKIWDFNALRASVEKHYIP